MKIFCLFALLLSLLLKPLLLLIFAIGHSFLLWQQEQYQTIYEAAKMFAINSAVYTNVEVAPPQKPLRKGDKERRQTNSGRRQSKETKGERKDKDRPNGRLSGNASGRANGSVSSVNGSANSANGSANAVNGSANGTVAAQAPAEDGNAENRASSRASGEGGTILINGKGHVNFSL